MEVIFIKDLKGQGKENEVKNVSDGYALNYLIPNGYAVKATAGKIATLNEKLKIRKEEDKLGVAETEQQKRVLEEIKPLFKLAVSETDKANGSITAQDIVDVLKDEFNIELSPKKFKNFKNIKSLGVTTVLINLDYGIKATLKIMVERK